ncbi:hypothetical protein Pla110_39260 [Polystyrenella longa]|uniref:DUF368 domain-containing protein n=1 Tax=Polystyrenella longa TaxID=2528007 RepID=A0A518CSG3_9PLAN|nr:DUF368 domain-containing protein [Polystyrenella longa]QDU82171.1 hypothetical protein Pla110_39260 [Polystyrenella longa]
MKNDLLMVARGFLMGGADIIPGVSGGTIALIVGIYERLVKAISHFDLTLLGHLKRGDFAAAVEHVDLRFLATLFLGIGTGIVSLASLMHYLLEHQQQHTMAVFFGLILGSSLIVARLIPEKKAVHGICLLIGIVVAYGIVGLPMFDNPPEHDWYFFFCGVIAISAMILPGISGSFILLILGTYHTITGYLRAMLGGSIELTQLGSLGWFALGALVGLIGFSKILRWLLERYEMLVLATLCGFMLGSLRRIWPFQVDRTPEESEFKLKVFENTFPDLSAGSTWFSLLLMLVAFGAVILLDRTQRKYKKQEQIENL